MKETKICTIVNQNDNDNTYELSIQLKNKEIIGRIIPRVTAVKLAAEDINCKNGNEFLISLQKERNKKNIVN